MRGQCHGIYVICTHPFSYSFLQLNRQQGPLSHIFLVAPPNLDAWEAAEALSGHTHDHEDHDDTEEEEEEEEEDGDAWGHEHEHEHTHDGSCGCGEGEEEEGVKLSGLVAVLDAGSFWEEWRRADAVGERGDLLMEEEEGEEEHRTVADLLCSQIESAGAIVLVTAAGHGKGEEEGVEAAVRCLNPGATIVSHTVEGELSLLLSEEEEQEGFDVTAAEEQAGWLRLLNSDATEDGVEGEGWGLVFRARRPFHPQRLWAFVTQEKGPMEVDVLRSKGFFWLATRHDAIGLWSHAGGSFSPGMAGAWWCVTPEDEWPEGEDVTGDFEGEWGDRRQEVAFVGVKGEGKRRVQEGLEGCLVTAEEMAGGPDAWREGMDDPFPPW